MLICLRSMVVTSSSCSHALTEIEIEIVDCTVMITTAFTLLEKINEMKLYVGTKNKNYFVFIEFKIKTNRISGSFVGFSE